MLAIISDIHSNTEALTAVLDDIRQREVQRIVCLGDIVGYGPDPRQCLELVRQNAS
ncbi:MAG: metallophosphoesterase family protein, partial [Planctomycetota bacterium]